MLHPGWGLLLAADPPLAYEASRRVPSQIQDSNQTARTIMPDRPSGNPPETASEHNPCPADCDVPPEASPERLEQQGTAAKTRIAARPGAV